MSAFKLHSEYQPTGDQPEAIEALTTGAKAGTPAQVLLGVTGSGKTFTIANVIKNLNKPTLVLSHNKTLAAQLYTEFKDFFPENAVEYYVSYYDYYQPEAYIPSSDLYIEKDMAINEEIDRLRLAATSALLSGRKDVIVVSSVSCIYGMGNPAAFYENVIDLKVGSSIGVTQLLQKLIASLYTRNDVAPKSGNFRVNGDTVDIYLAYTEEIIRVTFWGDDVDTIEEIDALSGYRSATFEEYKVYPANLFLTSKETQELAIRSIQDDLVEQVQKFEEEGKMLEAKRLSERVSYDIEMIRELGHCSGIENYSRYFDGRSPGTRPYCLLDFFPEDFLIVIDESHVTVPQIRAMWGGDRHRKVNLVNYGFRLPAALDNRPLTFDEFHQMAKQVIYISATPDDYELQESEGVIVEQIIRPTGLLDPPIEVRPNDYPIDDLMEEIWQCIEREERVLVTTLTKKMSEELTDYLLKNGIKTAYIHSDIDTLERVRIMEDLRKGTYDVLVGVNLLREGLDLPEVALVAILDADKEGFLRSTRSMTQTAGRAARNVNGRVIMYANRITTSMQQTIDETNRRRAKQIAYNEQHHLKPRQIKKKIKTNQLTELSEARQSEKSTTTYDLRQTSTLKAAEDQAVYGKKETYEERHARLEKQMKTAAEHLDFVLAAQLRDELLAIEKEHKNGH
ncbi:excinuclease ABC subunit UvrB [Alloprevotella tannerae]|jgi:excinuclease ABC, B subunit|uniref:excinuclease ABC subunit UvrB n=1 Tax=Alloprevotella tannerae TaxID=76122 RepID=UPI001EDA0F49|nr:excinuclease ABC subunit UvrB [Alloprevotella tannerae]MCG2650484.1 excinuclease ABC subunit UvrB [Alloprevotella tannerae]